MGRQGSDLLKAKLPTLVFVQICITIQLEEGVRMSTITLWDSLKKKKRKKKNTERSKQALIGQIQRQTNGVGNLFRE